MLPGWQMRDKTLLEWYSFDVALFPVSIFRYRIPIRRRPTGWSWEAVVEAVEYPLIAAKGVFG